LAAVHWPALPHVELARVADVQPELAAEAAARYGWRESRGDWREVTRAADADLVDVVTPNDAHAEIAIDAARHGKHGACEKPLAPGRAVDDATDLLLALEGGGAGSLQLSWAAAGHRHSLGFELSGSDGAIRFCWERANELELCIGSDGYRRVGIGPEHRDGGLL